MERNVKHVRNILLVNAHSANNVGDQAILRGTLLGLSKAFPSASLTLAANDPESWQGYESLTVLPSLCSWVADCRLGEFRRGSWRFPFVIVWLGLVVAVYRLTSRCLLRGSDNHRRLLAAYCRADVVLSCGGGNFYAHHSPSPALFWALMAPALGVALGKPVYLLPQSLGPIAGRWQQMLTRLILNRVRQLMVRDSVSLAYCRDQLRLRCPLHLFPDLAFALQTEPVPAAGQEPLQVGVTVIDRGSQNRRFERQEAYEAAVVQVLGWLQRERGAVITIFAQCYGPSPDQDDRAVSRRVAARLTERGVPALVRDDLRDPCALQQAYSRMSLVIATRMHTAIMALSGGTPAIVVSYQPKALGMMADFGLEPSVVDIDAVTGLDLQAMAESILDQGEALRSQVTEQAAVMRSRLESWVGLVDG